MGSSTVVQIGTKKDFEVVWVDRHTQIWKDLNNVNAEIYHYDEAKAGEIVSPKQEPYYLIEDVNDIVDINVLNSSGYISNHFQLQLDMIVNDLGSLNCPPNSYTVRNTTNKVSLINGQKNFALSACELAQLINISATGFSAYANDGGFLVLKSNYKSSISYIEVGNGSFNCPTGLVLGTRVYGTDIMRVSDLPPQPMAHIDSGRYVLPGIEIDSPIFIVGERYYVLYNGFCPCTGTPEWSEEDFSVVDWGHHPIMSFSFTV